jgi:hypothetical protein
MKLRTALLALMLATVGGAASAHHSLDKYNSGKAVSLTGVIRKVDIQNPHVTMQLETRGPAGPVLWLINMANPGLLKRRSIDLQVLEVGRQVTIESWPVKTGDPAASGRTLITPDGRRFDVGDPPGWTEVRSR